MRKHYAFLERELSANGAWYLGERSFADAYLYVLARWLPLTPIALDDYAAIKAHATRMETDDAVLAALERQGMEPLGLK